MFLTVVLSEKYRAQSVTFMAKPRSARPIQGFDIDLTLTLRF